MAAVRASCESSGHNHGVTTPYTCTAHPRSAALPSNGRQIGPALVNQPGDACEDQSP